MSTNICGRTYFRFVLVTWTIGADAAHHAITSRTLSNKGPKQLDSLYIVPVVVSMWNLFLLISLPFINFILT